MYKESFWDKMGTIIFKTMFYVGIVVAVVWGVWFLIQIIWTGVLFTAIGFLWCLDWILKRLK